MLNNKMPDYKTYALRVVSHLLDAFQILMMILVGEHAKQCSQSKK